MPISTIGTNSLSATAQIGSLTTASGSAPSYSARAWVNFNGTGTVAIRASGNVSSITDNGTGDYTVNFTVAMPDANYDVSGSCSWVTSGWGNLFMLDTILMSTTAVRCRTMNAGQAASFVLQDSFTVTVSVFR